MLKRKVCNIKEVNKAQSFEKVTFRCDSCGNGLKIDKVSKLGIFCSCPSCNTSAIYKTVRAKTTNKMVKTIKKSNIDTYQSNPELSITPKMIANKKIDFAFLNNGTRRKSSIRKDENPEITPGSKLALSFMDFAISSGFLYFLYNFKDTVLNNKTFSTFLIALAASLGATVSGFWGLKNAFSLQDGAVASIIRSMRANLDENQIVSIENEKPRQRVLRKANHDRYY